MLCKWRRTRGLVSDPPSLPWPNGLKLLRNILSPVILLGCLCNYVLAQDHIFSFEPEHCAENDGHLNVMLRTGFVFRFPVDDILTINWGGNAISGADESSRAPIGCAQNPAVVDSIRLRISPDWDEAVPARSWRPIRTTVSRYEGANSRLQSNHRIATEKTARFVHLNDDLEIFRGKPGEGYGLLDGGAFFSSQTGKIPIVAGHAVCHLVHAGNSQGQRKELPRGIWSRRGALCRLPVLGSAIRSGSGDFGTGSPYSPLPESALRR